MTLLGKAIKIAVDAHAGQVDKGGNPYILHPLKVMHYVKSTDEQLLAIAVLHDTVEDSPLTYKDLADAGMTQRVIAGVKALTKIPGETYEEYKSKVKNNPDAVIVKKADLRHNSDIRRLKNKEVTDKDIARLTKYAKFYQELLAHDAK